MQRLFGTDRLLTLAIKPLHVNDIQNAERNLNYVLLLKSCLDTIPELEAILATGSQPFFVKMRKVYMRWSHHYNLSMYVINVMRHIQIY